MQSFSAAAFACASALPGEGARLFSISIKCLGRKNFSMQNRPIGRFCRFLPIWLCVAAAVLIVQKTLTAVSNLRPFHPAN
jgi:hypothetical protein